MFCTECLFLCISDFIFHRKRRDLKRYSDYNPEDLEMAVQAVKSGAMNSYQAARHFHVPRGTVAYRIYKKQ
jgi:DNA-directed RNA polymerase specialized sigma24 family protein